MKKSILLWQLSGSWLLELKDSLKLSKSLTHQLFWQSLLIKNIFCHHDITKVLQLFCRYVHHRTLCSSILILLSFSLFLPTLLIYLFPLAFVFVIFFIIVIVFIGLYIVAHSANLPFSPQNLCWWSHKAFPFWKIWPGHILIVDVDAWKIFSSKTTIIILVFLLIVHFEHWNLDLRADSSFRTLWT